MKNFLKTPILLPLLFSMFLFGCISCDSNGQNNRKNDLQELNLHGNVKTIKESPYDAINKSGVISKGKSYSSGISTYNKRGDIVEFNDEGDVMNYNQREIKPRSNKYKYKYDGNGNMIEKEKYSFNDRFMEREKFIYDDFGNNIELNLYSTGITRILFMEYDDQTNKIQEYANNTNGDIKYKMTFKYDDKGNKIEENKFYVENSIVVEDSIIEKYIYKYDSKGNKIEWAFSDANFKIYWTVVYSYDAYGNIIEENENFNLNGEPGTKKNHQYKYDKYGNWIERIDFENDIAKYIFERVIEYY